MRRRGPAGGRRARGGKSREPQSRRASASGCGRPASSGLGTQRAPHGVLWSPARFLAAAPASASARSRDSSAAPRPPPTSPRLPASLAAPRAQRALRRGLAGSQARGLAASGGARPPGLLAGPARHAPYPASLAGSPGLHPQPGLRSGSPSSREILGYLYLWLAPRGLLKLAPAAPIPATGLQVL